MKDYMPQLASRYKTTKDIAFLYICIDRHPLPEVRWKDKVRMYKPLGYHVLVKDEEEVQLARNITRQPMDGKYFAYTPFYAIVDKQGRIISNTSPDPGKGEIRPSGISALYHKLDSLRNL